METVVCGMSKPMVHRRTLLGAVPATALVMAGCGSSSGSAGDGSGAGQAVAGLGTVQTFPPEQRPAAPAVTGELLDGNRFDLAGWRGKVVVVNWWGSWCAPCRAEAPHLRAVYEATHDLGVEFLGVDVRDGRDAANAFVQAFGHTWPSLFDPAGRVALAFQGVPPTVVPATVLIDRQHRIATIFRKAIRQPELEPPVRALAAENPQPDPRIVQRR